MKHHAEISKVLVQELNAFARASGRVKEAQIIIETAGPGPAQAVVECDRGHTCATVETSGVAWRAFEDLARMQTGATRVGSLAPDGCTMGQMACSMSRR
jgi:hypothetical protein